MAANEPENLFWELDNVGWLTNRKDVDYSPVVSKTPALGAYHQLSEGLHVLLAAGDRADRGDPLPPRGAADEGL